MKRKTQLWFDAFWIVFAIAWGLFVVIIVSALAGGWVR